MSPAKDGGPAFPSEDQVVGYQGMSTQTWLVGQLAAGPYCGAVIESIRGAAKVDEGGLDELLAINLADMASAILKVLEL